MALKIRAAMFWVAMVVALVVTLPAGAQTTSPIPITQYCVLTATGYCPNATGLSVVKQGVDTHSVFITPVGTPGTITVLLQGSVKGDFTDAATCGTSSTTTPNKLTCTGQYTAIRVSMTVFTGFTSVELFYVGTSTAAKGGGGAPSGAAGGDLAGTYPNPTVANLSNVSNGSLANAGLANPATTVNGQTCTLGSTCTVTANPPTTIPACSAVTGGSPVTGTCKLTLSSANLLALKTAQTAIGAQGANTLIHFISGSFLYHFVTTPYVAVSSIAFVLGTDTLPYQVDTTGLLDAGEDTYQDFYTIQEAITPTKVQIATTGNVNQPLQIKYQSVSNMTTGDGTATVLITYAIYPTN